MPGFLPSGETVRYLFPADALLQGGYGFGTIIAITDTKVTILSCSHFRRNKPTDVWTQYPRATQIGPVDTSLTPTFTLGKLTMETDEEYVPLIRAADAEISATDYLPPDPLPHL